MFTDKGLFLLILALSITAFAPSAHANGNLPWGFDFELQGKATMTAECDGGKTIYVKYEGKNNGVPYTGTTMLVEGGKMYYTLLQSPRMKRATVVTFVKEGDGSPEKIDVAERDHQLVDEAPEWFAASNGKKNDCQISSDEIDRNKGRLVAK